MGTEVLKSFDSLQEELDKAKNNLKGLNDNIRRIIGRDPADSHNRNERKRNFPDTRTRNDYNTMDRDRNRHRDGSPANKRRHTETKSVFSRLSGPPPRDDETKPKLHSRVIKEMPSRQEIVAAQCSDEQSRARNRRMFGSLLGTLQKFCQEESRLKTKEEKKAKIEKKLEEQQLLERENLKKERQTLFSTRKRQQLEIRMLEQKMNRVKDLELWEESKVPLKHFIRTKTKPHLYYRPKIMNSSTEKLLSVCRSSIEDEIAKKKQEVNDEMANIEERFKTSGNNYSADVIEKDTDRSASKHNRRNSEEDEDDNDSMFNPSDAENVDGDDSNESNGNERIKNTVLKSQMVLQHSENHDDNDSSRDDSQMQ